MQFHEHNADAKNIIKKMPDRLQFERVAETFQLIGDPSRLKILWLLSHCELCVNNIAFAVGMSAPAVSHHLKALRQSGLIGSRRDGKEVYYKISDTAEADLVHRAVDDVLDIKCPKRLTNKK